MYKVLLVRWATILTVFFPLLVQAFPTELYQRNLDELVANFLTNFHSRPKRGVREAAHFAKAIQKLVQEKQLAATYILSKYRSVLILHAGGLRRHSELLKSVAETDSLRTYQETLINELRLFEDTVREAVDANTEIPASFYTKSDNWLPANKVELHRLLGDYLSEIRFKSSEARQGTGDIAKELLRMVFAEPLTSSYLMKDYRERLLEKTKEALTSFRELLCPENFRREMSGLRAHIDILEQFEHVLSTMPAPSVTAREEAERALQTPNISDPFERLLFSGLVGLDTAAATAAANLLLERTEISDALRDALLEILTNPPAGRHLLPILARSILERRTVQDLHALTASLTARRIPEELRAQALRCAKQIILLLEEPAEEQ